MSAAEPAVGLRVSVPVACFRVPRAREYFETFPCPPPATVYGMLLALVGEWDRRRHTGAEVAIGVLGEPATSIVLRTLWRVKNKKVALGSGENKRPDFQELLTHVHLSVWLRDGTEAQDESLASRVRQTLINPSLTARAGGLSLGESTHLVDEISSWSVHDAGPGRWLVTDESGNLAMPVWPNHVGAKGTVWKQFRLQDAHFELTPPESAWVCIRPV